MLLPLLFLALLLSAALATVCAILFRSLHQQKAVAAESKERADAERARRQVYEKSLALPFWDEEELQRELWNRAANGDPAAEGVLEEIIWENTPPEEISFWPQKSSKL